eukprot:302556-Prorocentrum_minimum.AAC.2
MRGLVACSYLGPVERERLDHGQDLEENERDVEGGVPPRAERVHHPPGGESTGTGGESTGIGGDLTGTG